MNPELVNYYQVQLRIRRAKISIARSVKPKSEAIQNESSIPARNCKFNRRVSRAYGNQFPAIAHSTPPPTTQPLFRLEALIEAPVFKFVMVA